MDFEAFWIWFGQTFSTSSAFDSTQTIVDQIHQAVIQLDERIEVEVSEKDSNHRRELIFSGSGNEELFPMIEGLVSTAPKMLGWHFVALRPARGFEFNYRQSDTRLSPSQWNFLPLRDGEKNLGLRIFIPGKPVELSMDLLRRTLETGVGEKALSRIQYLDYVQDPNDLKSNKWLAISQLAEFLRWESLRTASNTSSH